MNPFRSVRRPSESPFSLLAPGGSFIQSLYIRLRLLTRTKAVGLAACVAVFFILTGHRIASYKMNTMEWVKAPINDIQRTCPAPSYKTLAATEKPKICMTTLTDAKKGSVVQRFVRWRNFDSLLEMTWPNKQAYVKKHGYYLFDESDSLDPSRPPSWSKIRAAQRLLKEESCDWVFWLDADTVIMNSAKTVEAFLPADTQKDLILTRQKGGSYNAGAWLIRKSDWSLHFLDTWWNMREFVHPPGMSTSGDNAALKAYLTERMDPAEFKKHIVVPPRCTYNSVTVFVSPAEAALVTSMQDIEKQEYYMKVGKYHKGDLIAHVAGKNNKIDTTAILLKDAV